MGISKLTDKRTKIRPKTNHSKRARLILSAYHIRFIFFFLISYYVANIIRCRWFHELPISYHSLSNDLEAPSIPWSCVRRSGPFPRKQRKACQRTVPNSVRPNRSCQDSKRDDIAAQSGGKKERRTSVNSVRFQY